MSGISSDGDSKCELYKKEKSKEPSRSSSIKEGKETKVKVNEGEQMQLENLRRGNKKRNMRNIIYTIYVSAQIYYIIYTFGYTYD